MNAFLIRCDDATVLHEDEIFQIYRLVEDLVTSKMSAQALALVNGQLWQFNIGTDGFTWKALNPSDELPSLGVRGTPTRIAWHEESGLIALSELTLGGRSGTQIRFLQLPSRTLRDAQIDTTDHIWDFQFSPDGRYLYAVGETSTGGRIWTYDLNQIPRRQPEEK